MLRIALVGTVLALALACSSSEGADDVEGDYAPDPSCDDVTCVARCRERSGAEGLCTWRGCECAATPR